MKNKRNKVYEVEKQIMKLIEKEEDMEIIKKEIFKLRKYNYDKYVQTNIKVLKKNPKKYHQLLQNIIQWNIELGNQNALGATSDLDPSQVYESKNGKILYGKEAKNQVYEEWKEEYQVNGENNNEERKQI